MANKTTKVTYKEPGNYFSANMLKVAKEFDEQQKKAKKEESKKKK